MIRDYALKDCRHLAVLVKIARPGDGLEYLLRAVLTLVEAAQLLFGTPPQNIDKSSAVTESA